MYWWFWKSSLVVHTIQYRIYIYVDLYMYIYIYNSSAATDSDGRDERMVAPPSQFDTKGIE